MTLNWMLSVVAFTLVATAAAMAFSASGASGNPTAPDTSNQEATTGSDNVAGVAAKFEAMMSSDAGTRIASGDDWAARLLSTGGPVEESYCVEVEGNGGMCVADTQLDFFGVVLVDGSEVPVAVWQVPDGIATVRVWGARGEASEDVDVVRPEGTVGFAAMLMPFPGSCFEYVGLDNDGAAVTEVTQRPATAASVKANSCGEW